MKCLVTGGAGFIGSHLVEALLAKGHSVTVLDNLKTGQQKNINLFEWKPGFRFIKADIADFEKIQPYFDGIDWVFHLAALADIVPSMERPMDYHHANVNGTIAVLEASRKANVKKFLYTASSSCYGIPESYPTPETAAIQPQYPYALTKYLGEQLAMHWAQIYHLPVISLRLFNVYGPRARTTGTYGAVFGVFLAQKLAGKPYTVVGDGTQTRDFTYVTDVVAAFLKAAASPIRSEIFNVGSGNTYSVNKLVALLGGEVASIPKRPGEPDCTFADIKKIKKVLGWSPCIAFEEGVEKMLNHIQDWKTAPVWDKASIADATKDWFTYLGAANRV